MPWEWDLAWGTGSTSTTICHLSPCYCEQQWRLDRLCGLTQGPPLLLMAVKLVSFSHIPLWNVTRREELQTVASNYDVC
ncbi:hypothetical protein V6N13_017167 [Hibiscus sabdariffa]